MRGVLGSTICLSNNVGMLLGFTIGSYCDYDMTPKLVVGLTILCAASLFFFPESPTFLLKQGNVSVSNVKEIQRHIFFCFILKEFNISIKLIISP